MKILFDQGTPVPLRRTLVDHYVTTAYEAGWSTLRNGQLLANAEAQGYDLLIPPTGICGISKTSLAVVSLFSLSAPPRGRVSNNTLPSFGRLSSK